VLAGVVAVVAGSLAASSLLGQPAAVRAGLPTTPRAWLDAYEAAAVDNPPRVCTQLFSPALAAAYARAAHSTCTVYFARMSSSSVTVRRILTDGAAAELELRQTLDHADWAVVLDHRTGGWQAVDLLDGRLAR
jgi:hypothetical protein